MRWTLTIIMTLALGCMTDTSEGEVLPGPGKELGWTIEISTNGWTTESIDLPETEPGYTDRILWEGPGFIQTLGFSAGGGTLAWMTKYNSYAGTLYLADTDTGDQVVVDQDVVALDLQSPVHLSHDAGLVLYRVVSEADVDPSFQSDLHYWDWKSGGEPVFIAERVVRNSYRLTPDNKRVIYVSMNHDLNVYDLATGEDHLLDTKAVTSAYGNPRAKYPVSDDGVFLAYNRGKTASYGSLQVVNLETGVAQEIAPEVLHRSFRWQGHRLVFVDRGDWHSWRNVIWDANSGERIEGGLGLLSDWSMSADWRYSAYVRKMGDTLSLYVWDFVEGTEEWIDSGARVHHYYWDPTSRRLAYLRHYGNAGAYTGDMWVWDSETGLRTQVAESAMSGYSGLGGTFSPDGESLLYAQHDCKEAEGLRIWTASKVEVVNPSLPTCVAKAGTFLPSGGVLAIQHGKNRTDLIHWNDGQSIVVQEDVWDYIVLPSPDGNKLVIPRQRTSVQDARLFAWNWAEGTSRLLYEGDLNVRLGRISNRHVAYSTYNGKSASLILAELP